MPSFDRETRWTEGRAAARACCSPCASACCSPASASAAAPNWLEPADLSKPGRNASNPAVAMDAAGNTIAIWERQSTIDPGFNLQIVDPRGGRRLHALRSTSALKSTEPQLAMTAGGEAVAAWKTLRKPARQLRDPGRDPAARAARFSAADHRPHDAAGR